MSKDGANGTARCEASTAIRQPRLQAPKETSEEGRQRKQLEPLITTRAMSVIENVKEAVGLGQGPKTQATREEMSAAKLPLAYRDTCAHLLIPLNKCRTDTMFLPWKCNDERHSYEKCQYEEFKLRVKKMEELKAANDGARSN